MNFENIYTKQMRTNYENREETVMIRVCLETK